METIKQRARRVAREFKAGRGRAWAWVGDRDAIIDAECMDQVRAAASVGGSFPASEIMEFRAAFVDAIRSMGYVQ